jgi:hypothetical protein
MSKKFEAVGTWWLPEHPERPVQGILKYDPTSGAILQVMGSLEPLDSHSQFNDYDIINGFIGSDITLYKCWTKSAPAFCFHSETVSTTYYANIIFKGHIFKTVSDIKLRHAIVNYNNFGSWFFRHTISHTRQNTRNYSLTTQELDPIIANIDENLKISLISTNEECIKWERDGCRSTIKERSYLVIDTSKDIDYSQLMEISVTIQQFLTLAINKPIDILTLWIVIPNEDGKNDSVEVFFEISKDVRGNNKPIHPSEMPFSFNVISDRFEVILKNWFVRRPALSPIFNLYFALQYHEPKYVEHAFLNLVSCLESYHRRCFEGKYLSDENYDKFKMLVTKSLPPIDDENYRKFKSKFIHSLKYGNELSLRRRLELILSDNEKVVSQYIANPDPFIEKVVNTRNYRTHFDKSLELLSISEVNEYLDYNQKLTLLVELCILKEIGFSLEEIVSIFERNRRYQKIKLNPLKELGK